MKKTEIKVKAGSIIAKTIGDNLNTKQSVQFNLNASYMNLLFHLHRYQADLDILLYKDGNINVRLKSDDEEYLIEYYKFNKEDDLTSLSQIIEREMRELIEVYLTKEISWYGIVSTLQYYQVVGEDNLNNGSKWIEEYIRPLVEMNERNG